jgi:N-acetylmuramoyl-L-alanine amidase
MSFKMKYEIIENFITSSSRPKKKAKGRTFGVVHDTGNVNSTALSNRNWFQDSAPEASAHSFTDDKEIILLMPMDEIAWHVRYSVSNANDYAVGHELCYFTDIKRSKKAYEKFVWLWAYTCYKYDFDPHKDLRTHAELDPSRRTDPHNAFKRIGITWEKFLDDIKAEMEDCMNKNEPSNWAKKDWEWAIEAGLFDGTRPKDLLTRQEMAIVARRILNMKGGK